MRPFISSVKVVKVRDEGLSSLVSIFLLSVLLALYIAFIMWANNHVKAKQEEKKVLAEQIENSNKV